MNYSKLKLNEDNKINIFANMIIKDSIETITEKNKYVNHFCKGLINNNINEYLFYIVLSEKNMELIMDSNSILEGKLLENKYNSFLTEDSIILLFMRLKIYILSGISKLRYDSVFQDIYDKNINKYEDFLDRETRLLERELDIKTKNELIIKEVNKAKKYRLGFYLILSYYLYIYELSKRDNYDKKLLINFIEKIDKICVDFLEKEENLNVHLDDFWKYLISCI